MMLLLVGKLCLTVIFYRRFGGGYHRIGAGAQLFINLTLNLVCANW